MNSFTKAICAFALTAISGSTLVNAQNITVTLAGNGITGFSGDGGTSFSSEVNSPSDVCTDAAHNIYIADNGSGIIRKISAKNGVMSTFAGGGTFTADGVAATSAILSPAYLCMDAAGNLYVSTGNQVRVINAITGIITTVAGNGTAGYMGDGGAATAAELNTPGGICLDNIGNLYIVDGGAAVWLTSPGSVTYIRKVHLATGIITTIAGTGTPGYSGDGGPASAAQIQNAIAICANSAGDIYFTDQPSTLSFGGGAYIRKISAATGIITTIGGNGGYPADGDGGLASAACLGNLYGLCCDDSDNLYGCDISCSCRKINMTTGIITTIAGSDIDDGYNGDGGSSPLEYLNWPYGLCVDHAGNVLIADHSNNRIRFAMQLTHTPAFAYGSGQYLNTCPGIPNNLDRQLSVADLDLAQTETWTVATPPVHGTLTGFPASAMSKGTDSVTIPAGTAYTSAGTYAGMDSFTVNVSDGTLSSMLTIYVNVNLSMPGSIIGTTTPCLGTPSYFEDPGANGTWGVYNNTIANIPSLVGYDTTVLNITAAGIDTIYYSTSTGCDAMTFTAGPFAGSIAGSATLCKDAETTYANTVAGGVWTAANGNATVSSLGIITGVSAGTDTIYYSVSGTCGTAAAQQEIVIHDCTAGVASVSSSAPVIDIYPNPATSVLTIACTNWQNNAAPVRITDITGRELYTGTITSTGGTGSTQVDITSFPSGIYFIKVDNNEVKKFVKQ